MVAAMSAERAIVVVKTGEPVASVASRRGSFKDLIVGAAGDAWAGPWTEVDARTGPFPEPRGAAAFVITGSAANVPDREPWMLELEAWLRRVVDSGTPTFGICFGHQALAQALGGEVVRNARGREIGTVSIEITADDPALWPAGASRTFVANATHVDTVVRLPPGAAVLARSGLDDHQAVRFSPRCHSVQFHPEIDADVMRGYVDSRREILAREGFDVDALVERIDDGAGGTDVLRRWIRVVVGSP